MELCVNGNSTAKCLSLHLILVRVFLPSIYMKFGKTFGRAWFKRDQNGSLTQKSFLLAQLKVGGETEIRAVDDNDETILVQIVEFSCIFVTAVICFVKYDMQYG